VQDGPKALLPATRFPAFCRPSLKLDAGVCQEHSPRSALPRVQLSVIPTRVATLAQPGVGVPELLCGQHVTSVERQTTTCLSREVCVQLHADRSVSDVAWPRVVTSVRGNVSPPSSGRSSPALVQLPAQEPRLSVVMSGVRVPQLNGVR
jgi:hypothetical protein